MADPVSEVQHDLNADQIKHNFGFHPATDVTGPQHTQVRGMLQELAHNLDWLLKGSSREKSLVMTKLEEAMMWANAHIARHHGDQPHPMTASDGGK